MEAALTFVPIAIIVAVHTHSLVFTRTLCHPVFDLAKEGQGDRSAATLRWRPAFKADYGYCKNTYVKCIQHL